MPPDTDGSGCESQQIPSTSSSSSSSPPAPIPCCLWCEAGWRPIMSLCLFRQSCLKLWCVTRAELYSLRPTSGHGIKASRQCLHLPQEDKGSSEKHLNTALPQWNLDSFFLRVLFLFFQTSELTAKNAPALKWTYLSSPWWSDWTTIYFLLHLEGWREEDERPFLRSAIFLPSVAKFLIQAPQNMVPLV